MHCIRQDREKSTWRKAFELELRKISFSVDRVVVRMPYLRNGEEGNT